MKIKCPACNFENEEGAKFCSNCNEPLATQSFSKNNPFLKKEKERVMRTCGNCGFSLPEGATKCPECGKNVCKNCGNILGAGVTKCPKCGEPTMLGSLQSVGCFMTFIGFFIIIIIIVFLIK